MEEYLSLCEKYSTTRHLFKALPNLSFQERVFENTKKKGGLRMKGYVKKSLPNSPLITVITVVLNEAESLKKTMASVFNQDYENIEYIIIDGASSDSTLDIIKENEDKVDYWISEPDKGIFDAMNKGIDLASGEWINFMNAGDYFYQNDTVKTVFGKDYGDADFIFGDTFFLGGDYYGVVKSWDFKILWKTMVFTHQSLFTHSRILKNRKFNTKFKICADYDIIYNSYMQGKKFFNSETVISVFDPGFSDVSRSRMAYEKWKVVKKHRHDFAVHKFYLQLFFNRFFRDMRKRSEKAKREKKEIKMKNIEISMLKTYYPHWGEHTAFNSFLKYFDRQQFKINTKNVPMGDETFHFPSFLKKYCRKKIAKKGVQEYKLNDLRAETAMFIKTIFKKVDVVHFLDSEHTLMFFPYWNKRLRFLRSTPKIIAMFHQPPSILKKIINFAIIGRVDQVLVVSPAQEEYFAQYLPRERITTILLGVDTEHFKPLPKTKTSKVFKLLGGGVWLRDYDAVFATAQLLRGIPEIEFHLVAPQKINTTNLDNVIFHEGIPDSELMNLYQTCDALFLPFKDATANTFLLEGCACGLPVISSDIPSIKAYFPGEEAVLIAKNDPKAFAKTIIDLYNNPEKLSRMSIRARERALQLSWNNICTEYERMYLKLLANNGQTAGTNPSRLSCEKNEDEKKELEVTVTNIKNGMIRFLRENPKDFFKINLAQIEEYTREFIEIYPGRPVKKNIGGADVVPIYWLFVISKWLNPRLIIESGVWKGQTSWMLRKANPTAEIHAFDICLGNLVYRDSTISYHEHDWINSEIRNKNPGTGLIFFDDHINQAKRVREAYERGFKWMIFDDNVPVNQIKRIGLPALPSIGMLFDPQLKEGDIIKWELDNKEYSYVFSEKDTFGARELIEYYLVVPNFTCLTLVKLK